MTRGKYGRPAAVRREAAEQQAEIDTYQRKIRELLAEVQTARARGEAIEKQRRREVELLRVQVAEAVSPALGVVEHENRTLRDERDHARREVADRRRKMGKLSEGLIEHAKAEHGMTGVEAMEWLMRLGGEHFTIDTVSTVSDPEVVRVIQRARGDRR